MEKQKIDTLILSDFHLGNKSTRCFEVLNVLDRYKYDQLILNGDIIDGLRFRRLHTEHWRILSKIRKLSKNCEVIWIHGNHDAAANILSQLLGIKVRNKYIWEAGDKKFLAIHGHQYDNLIISYFAFVFYYLIKRVDTTGYLVNYIKRHNGTWHRDSLEVAKGALRLGRNLGADYVFCGHTHLIYETQNQGVKYYNTGSWTEKPSGYITIAGEKVVLNKI